MGGLECNYTCLVWGYSVETSEGRLIYTRRTRQSIAKDPPSARTHGRPYYRTNGVRKSPTTDISSLVLSSALPRCGFGDPLRRLHATTPKCRVTNIT